ncbi:MAG: hypothetical protein WCK98_04760 [bacterium]
MNSKLVEKMKQKNKMAENPEVTQSVSKDKPNLLKQLGQWIGNKVASIRERISNIGKPKSVEMIEIDSLRAIDDVERQALNDKSTLESSLTSLTKYEDGVASNSETSPVQIDNSHETTVEPIEDTASPNEEAAKPDVKAELQAKEAENRAGLESLRDSPKYQASMSNPELLRQNPQISAWQAEMLRELNEKESQRQTQMKEEKAAKKLEAFKVYLSDLAKQPNSDSEKLINGKTASELLEIINTTGGVESIIADNKQQLSLAEIEVSNIKINLKNFMSNTKTNKLISEYISLTKTLEKGLKDYRTTQNQKESTRLYYVINDARGKLQDLNEGDKFDENIGIYERNFVQKLAKAEEGLQAAQKSQDFINTHLSSN